MLSTTLTLEGNLADTPQLAYTRSGKPTCEITVLVNRRRLDEATGEWVDTEPNRHQVKTYGPLAENTAASLTTGDRVIVIGDVVTDVWADKDTQAKRTGQKVIAETIGASLRWATAQPARTSTTPPANGS